MTAASAPTSASRLRAAIVGTGQIAHLHAAAIAAHPSVDLVAVNDLSSEAAQAFAGEFGGEVVATLPELLGAAAPDVLLICSPPIAHYEQVLAAFAAGVHVIVEKPPATSLEELDAMREAATRAERELVVVFQQRTGTAATHVKQLLDSGALGRPLLAQCQTLWYRDADYFAVPWRGHWETEGGGTSLGHGIHQVDLLAYMLGDWARVSGELWRLDRETETEDVSTGTVVFASGVVAQLVSSAVSPREVSSVRIDTTEATITVDHLYGHGHDNWRITPAPHVTAEQSMRWRLPASEESSGHAPFLRGVFDALLAGAPMPRFTEAPARSFEIVAASYASADAEGAWITPEALRAHPTHRRSFRSRVSDLRPE